MCTCVCVRICVCVFYLAGWLVVCLCFCVTCLCVSVLSVWSLVCPFARLFLYLLELMLCCWFVVGVCVCARLCICLSTCIVCFIMLACVFVIVVYVQR